MGKNIWYLPLEIVKARYTEQLCKTWIPDAINKSIDKKSLEDKLVFVEGQSKTTDIKVGHVLDATGRGYYSLTQCAKFLEHIDKGDVKNGDVIYVQDFWTPGLESIQYALDLYKLDVKWYSMLHAQSVDEYDFTYQMKEWMRPIELGYDKMFKTGGIFVGSSIHKEQLKDAGFEAPIHVVSLPFMYDEVDKRIQQYSKNTENAIVFSSRLDTEKNPFFMIDLAKDFLDLYQDWKFYITTSGKQIKSNEPKVIDTIRDMEKLYPNRFIVKEGITKDEYYQTLCNSKIQLNTSLQDYVSWTLLEAATCECDICYPDYRSFPECVPNDRRYKPWSKTDALRILKDCIDNSKTHQNIPIISNEGRLKAADIIVNGSKKEYDLWENFPINIFYKTGDLNG